DAVVHSVREGVIVADASGRPVVINSAARQIFGNAEAPLAGVFRTDGTTPFPADELPLAIALRGEMSKRVEMVVRPPGPGDEGVRVTMAARPLFGDDEEPVGGVVTFEDVSELRAMQARLKEHGADGEGAGAGAAGLPGAGALRERIAEHVAVAARGGGRV